MCLLDPKSTPHFSLEHRNEWLNDGALACFFQHINDPEILTKASSVESRMWESLEPEIVEEYRSFVGYRNILHTPEILIQCRNRFCQIRLLSSLFFPSITQSSGFSITLSTSSLCGRRWPVLQHWRGPQQSQVRSALVNAGLPVLPCRMIPTRM